MACQSVRHTVSPPVHIILVEFILAHPDATVATEQGRLLTALVLQKTLDMRQQKLVFQRLALREALEEQWEPRKVFLLGLVRVFL